MGVDDWLYSNSFAVGFIIVGLVLFIAVLILSGDTSTGIGRIWGSIGKIWG